MLRVQVERREGDEADYQIEGEKMNVVLQVACRNRGVAAIEAQPERDKVGGCHGHNVVENQETGYGLADD